MILLKRLEISFSRLQSYIFYYDKILIERSTFQKKIKCLLFLNLMLLKLTQLKCIF